MVRIMPKVNVNSVDIAYEEHGRASDPAMLLVQGLAMPLTAWPPEMIESIVDAGFRVLTVDNRDIGESQLLQDAKLPNLVLQAIRRKLNLKVTAPYQLDDMMLDLLGLLDELEIEKAHVVGISMGGMISQLLAIHARHRLNSLTSIMSSTSARNLPEQNFRITRQLLQRPEGGSPEDLLAHQMQTWRLIGSPDYPATEQYMLEFLQRVNGRGRTERGAVQQILAILAARDRTQRLCDVDLPTLVIHGKADPLVPVACGYATANAVPGARMRTFDGMGHDLPGELLPHITHDIVEHAKAAQ